MEKQSKYVAFISYRHILPDMDVAREVHRLIEEFKVPKELDPEGKYQGLRVFRDREELTTEDLSDSIDKALAESEYLIVICSKRTPASFWCTREVEEFLKTHSGDRIIPILVEGEPEDSFSEPLKNLKKKDREDKLELLAADVRPQPVKQPSFVGYEVLTDDTKQRELTKESLKILKQSEIYRIMATILGVSYGDLKQRQKERRMKRIMAASATAAAILLIFGLAMTSLYFKAVEAERQAKIAQREAEVQSTKALQENTSLQLDRAEQANASGNRGFAALLAMEAMESATPAMERYDALQADYLRVLNDAIMRPQYAVTHTINTRSFYANYAYIKAKNWLITAGEGYDLYVWDANHGGLINRIAMPSTVAGLGAAPDGKSLYVTTLDGSVHRVNLSDLKAEKLFAHEDTYYQQVADITEKYLVLSENNRTFTVFDTTTGKPLWSKTDKEGLSFINIKEDEGEMLVLNNFAKLEVLDPATGKLIKELNKEDPQMEGQAKITVGKNNIIALSQGEVIKIFNPEDDGIVEVTDGVSFISQLVFSPDGKKVYGLSGSLVGDINVWNVKDGKFLTSLPGNRDKITRMALSADGNQLAYAPREGKEIGINPPEYLSVDTEGNYSLGADLPEEVLGLEFVNEDKLLIVAGSDGLIRLIPMEHQGAVKRIKGELMGQSRDQETIILQEDGKTIKTYNFATGKETPFTTVAQPVDRILAPMSISDDGKMLAVADLETNAVKLLREDGKLYHMTQAHEKSHELSVITDVRFSKDGKRLFSLGEGGEVIVTDLAKKKTVQVFGKKKGSEDLFFTEDDSLVAISYQDETATVYDAATGKAIQELDGKLFHIEGTKGKLTKARGQRGTQIFTWQSGQETLVESNPERIAPPDRFGLTSLDFASNDGQWLLTAVNGKATVITDLATGYRLRTLPGKNDFLSWAFFDQEKKQVAFEHLKGEVVVVHSYDIKKLEDLAGEWLKGRQLTEEDRFSNSK